MKNCFALVGAVVVGITVSLLLIGCSRAEAIQTTTSYTTTDTAKTSATTTSTTITTSQTSVTLTTSTTTKTGTNWSLSLVGVITENVNQTLFAQGAAPGCHAEFWSDAQGHLWSGISLWLLAAYVDDNNPMGVPNDALWKQGFTIQISSDSSMVEYTSAQIEKNDNIVVAYRMDGKSLPVVQWPLALVGSAVDQPHQIAAITEIKLVLPPLITATPLTTAP